MSTRVLIIRHANTFDKGDQITRVGGRTDLPLSASGRRQAVDLGRHLYERFGKLDLAYTSTLKRTKETMDIVLSQFPSQTEHPEIHEDLRFNEIDYGPDENMPEDVVIARVGQDALDAWNSHCTPPPGWSLDPSALIDMWREFFATIQGVVGRNNTSHDGSHRNDAARTVAVVTSNGIARFVPYAIDDSEGFQHRFSLKLSTAAYGVVALTSEAARVLDWNYKGSH